MKYDQRLSGALHLLLHLAETREAQTSATLAQALHTNPVVIRRLLAGLREAGYVHSEKGHGGGWTLTCDLSQVTLLDIYTAVGSPTLFAMANRNEQTDCLVEQTVNASLQDTFQEAETLLRTRLGEVTLAALSTDLHHRLTRRGHSHKHPQHKHDS
ncbi:Rrf2 family transcriptional regulator [Gimesia chilikensis]|uniref:HTH-type transcriptional regulator YwnA n=1 Tax=Gimesia chilikensis TaxID=2605989 RepID=A0A517W532_9PLAN|nr:Rrf2 family transcriptional regulator [Gimesia chilikensis]QDU00359.1 Putative HTH-type transcriptional regulator YwnA [Gimesia chilikensis]